MERSWWAGENGKQKSSARGVPLLALALSGKVGPSEEDNHSKPCWTHLALGTHNKLNRPAMDVYLKLAFLYCGSLATSYELLRAFRHQNHV